MAIENYNPPAFVVIKKVELDALIHELDYIGMMIDTLLQAQDARRDLAECLPYDYASQSFLLGQHVSKNGGVR